MAYSTTYTDERGSSVPVSISDEESREAIRNDWNVLRGMFNHRYVTVEEAACESGEEFRFRITVHAPSHYLTDRDDASPKSCSSMSAEVTVFLGYPLKSVKATYPAKRRLASPNVFRSGAACIDEWKIYTSSMLTVAEKLVKDMIHDPAVTRYDSMANGDVADWHRAGVASGRFPTISPKLLEAPQRPPLPVRRAASGLGAPPPLPRRS